MSQNDPQHEQHKIDALAAEFLELWQRNVALWSGQSVPPKDPDTDGRGSSDAATSS